ncbi:MAG: hypothetical protein QHH14_01270 [Clostridiales bacterium]|nr:hypothetical protein [Clostridiales bacterium]
MAHSFLSISLFSKYHAKAFHTRVTYPGFYSFPARLSKKDYS